MVNRGTVLLIEDEEAIADPLRMYCEQEGFRLVHAPNGERGIEAVRDRDPRSCPGHRAARDGWRRGLSADPRHVGCPDHHADRP